MNERIRSLLLNLGLDSLPEGENEPLADYGFDSLITVLALGALEKEFSVKIPASRLEEFGTLASLENLLTELGAK